MDRGGAENEQFSYATASADHASVQAALERLLPQMHTLQAPRKREH